MINFRKDEWDIDCSSADGMTPLLISIRKDLRRTEEVLLNNGAGKMFSALLSYKRGTVFCA